jgi:arylsulfatase A-like enzyme
LEENQQLENTLFVFTTDNGCTLYNVPPYNAPNRGGKGTGWFGGLNVPLLIWGENLTRTGISQEIVSLADLMPTILDYVGADVPTSISGKSLIPYLTEIEETGPRKVLSSISIQSSRWSYFYDGNGENNTRDGMKAPLYAWHFDGVHLLMRVTPTKAGLYETLRDGLPEQVMLYDVTTDRRQLNNIAESNWERVEAMDHDLRAWIGTLSEPITSQHDDYQILLNKVEKNRFFPTASKETQIIELN